MDDSAQLKEALAGVDAAARRASAVTHKLLTFGRRDLTRAEVPGRGASFRMRLPLAPDQGIRAQHPMPPAG